MLALLVAALWVLRSLWVPVILASWFALVARPLQRWMAARMGRSARAAAVITVLLVVLGFTPFAIITLSLAGDAITLMQDVSKSGDLPNALKALIAGGGASPAEAVDALEPRGVVELARQHGVGALNTLGKVAGAVTSAIIGVVVFVYGFHQFLLHSEGVHRWLRDRAPLRKADFERYAEAYAETGRGLLIGLGLTAVLQGSVATIGYAAVGIPHALVLGLLTIIASLIPAVGAGLVWVPVAAGLALSGSTGSAIAITAVGCFISLADNFVRPALSRYGKLRLPTFVLFVAMLGGIAALGTWGLVLGPLLVRLSVEAFDVARSQVEREQRHGQAVNPRARGRREPTAPLLHRPSDFTV
jgi:predicted PurR-regulated permease PerM